MYNFTSQIGFYTELHMKIRTKQRISTNVIIIIYPIIPTFWQNNYQKKHAQEFF